MADIKTKPSEAMKRGAKPEPATRPKANTKKTSPVFLCILFTIAGAAGIAAAIITKNILFVIAGAAPAAVYEMFRTRGPLTIAASVGVAILLAAEAVLILLNSDIDVIKFLGFTYSGFSGAAVKLGDIRVMVPALAVLLSLVLVIRTAGPYTKWLSLVIIASSAVTAYMVAPVEFSEMIRWAAGSAADYLGGVFKIK